MSFIIPHTGLSYDPKRTDWEFLLPLELSDKQLVGETDKDAAMSRTVPLISGFIALIKVFVCIVDLLDTAFPGPPAYISLSPGALSARLLPESASLKDPLPHLLDLPLFECLSRVTATLDATLRHLPEELRIGETAANGPHDHLPTDVAGQFDVMRANVYITSIYIRSTILEMCLNKLQTLEQPGSPDQVYNAMPFDTVRAQLWQMKESLGGQLLDILRISSPDVLESNGLSLVSRTDPLMTLLVRV